MSDCLLMPCVLLRKEKGKNAGNRAPSPKKKYLYGNNMQIGFSDSHQQTCKLHLNCNKTAHSIMTLQKNRPRWNHQQGFPAKSNASYEGYFNICPWFRRRGILNFSSASLWHFIKHLEDFRIRILSLGRCIFLFFQGFFVSPFQSSLRGL